MRRRQRIVSVLGLCIGIWWAGLAVSAPPPSTARPAPAARTRPAAAASTPGPQVPDFKVEHYRLANGLDLILQEDHTTPVVAVNLWYKVGSKDERPGRTGFAHLFEHLMFQGSQHYNDDTTGLLEQVGGDFNGTTNPDRTEYYAIVPSSSLEQVLWLESDRMGFLLPALTQAKLDNQREVVKNERRETVDDVPGGRAHEAILEALYPPGHPYRHSEIGSMADLSAATLGDVGAFFRTHYTPDNASLCIVGDFRSAQAKQWVVRYFGSLPRGPRRARPAPRVPVLSAPKHVVLTDRIELPRAHLVWPTVPRGHADEKPLDVLASILGHLDKENRLYRASMHDRTLASEVEVQHPASLLSGEFQMVLIAARPDQGLDDLVAVADAEIERLKRQGPTAAEVAKAQATEQSQLVLSLESVGRRAEYLNGANVEFGDPLAFRAEMTRLFAVTPADVIRVANRYLGPNRVRVDVVAGAPAPRPPEPLPAAARTPPPPVPPAPPIVEGFDRRRIPRPGPASRFVPPPIVHRRLANGLEVLIAEQHALPIVTLDLVVRGGETLVPPGKEGLASMTAELLTEGTTTRDAFQLAGTLNALGGSLSADGELESSTVEMTVLAHQVPDTLPLLADVVRHPAFAPEALERLRARQRAALSARREDPVAIAGVVFPRILYGAGHPYGRPDLGTEESIDRLTRDDVAAFHRRLYRPNNAALIVVGDVKPEAVLPEIEAAFGGWEPGAVPASPRPAPPSARRPATVYLVDRPGATQSVLAVGQVGAPRSTPDYFPLMVMNAVLGGQFSSRINLNLREEKGYTYGAHSEFEFRLGPGPFQAGGSVRTDATRAALVELLRELNDIRGRRPITDAELAFAKNYIIEGFPQRFETTFGVAGALAELVLYRLPDDYFATYPVRVEAVTLADVARVVRTYLDPGRATILVVGDRARIGPSLRTLPGVRVVTVLDPDGNPLPDAPEAGAARAAAGGSSPRGR